MSGQLTVESGNHEDGNSVRTYQEKKESQGDAIHKETPESFSDPSADHSDADEEPKLHARTYIALAAMFLLNMVQVLALQGPPTVLTSIGKDLNDPAKQTWIPNALSLVQAVLGPIFSSASDVFQARKPLMVGCSLLSFVGAAIAPGATSIGRVIAAQTLIGFGFATVPLAYSVPSEILPRRWRPLSQSAMNIAAATGACLGPITIGALTRNNPHTGWRNFYWFQMALWGFVALSTFLGYQPPKRHVDLDDLSWRQKIQRLDLIGTLLLTTGLTLFLVALNLGGESYPWSSARVLSLLLVGIAVLGIFGFYEYKGTQTGILHHDLFRGGRNQGQTFTICIALMFIEAILLFSYVLFYPVLTAMLFETNPLLQAVRLLPLWIATALSTVVYGYVSSRFRTIRWPLFAGFFIFTAGIVGFATIEPNNNANAVVFAGLAGLGFGAPLILIISGVQLSTPHHLIATATAATTSTRAVGATIFTAIYSAALSTRLENYIPRYISKAVSNAGLPESSTGPFIKAFTGGVPEAVGQVPGVNVTIIEAGTLALKQAYADGLRVVFIIAAPFGLLACVLCLLLGDMRKTMNYHVDAPVEKLVMKRHATKADA